MQLLNRRFLGGRTPKYEQELAAIFLGHGEVKASDRSKKYLLIFEQDSLNNLTMVLCGQLQLRDKLSQRTVMLLCSGVTAHTHLANLSGQQMEDYLNHHVKFAGVSTALFEKSAINSVYQGSGGILRTANALARGGLVAASL